VKDDLEKRGLAVPEDSALGMVRRILSHDRRVKDGKIVARGDIMAKKFDALEAWEPKYFPDGTYNPNGGQNTRSGLVSRLAEKLGMHDSTMSQFLNGEQHQTCYQFLKVLGAMRTSGEETQEIMRSFFKENREAFAYQSSKTLLASEAFKEINFEQAIDALAACYMVREDTGKIVTIQEFIEMIPRIPPTQLGQYDRLTKESLSRVAGYDLSKHDKSSPLLMLKVYETLGLDYEQSAAMLAKSWDPKSEVWQNGPRDNAQPLHSGFVKLESIFTTPPDDDKRRLKSKGELLGELIAAHCVMRKRGGMSVTTWRDAATLLLEKMRTKRKDVFNDTYFRPLTQRDVAGIINMSGGRINTWIAGEQILSKHEELADCFSLPEPLRQAFIDAPNSLEDALALDARSTQRYRTRLEQGLAVAEHKQETYVPEADKDFGMRRIGSMRELVTREQEEGFIGAGHRR